MFFDLLCPPSQLQEMDLNQFEVKNMQESNKVCNPLPTMKYVSAQNDIIAWCRCVLIHMQTRRYSEHTPILKDSKGTLKPIWVKGSEAMVHGKANY